VRGLGFQSGKVISPGLGWIGAALDWKAKHGSLGRGGGSVEFMFCQLLRCEAVRSKGLRGGFVCFGLRDARWHFHDFRLCDDTAPSAKGAAAVCVFVNDQIDAACLRTLAVLGVRLVALRCSGFNNVDLSAARNEGIAVVRVPAYSPYAVAEHAVALLLTLNRQIHRAYNRVRDMNFSLSGLVGFDVRGKTVGIVGTGKIGQVTAELFRGFGVTLLGHDPLPQ